tara:strand:+ start:95 stop:1120 length:1026 start_codon:yes stop_codon:yes gene_type:complete
MNESKYISPTTNGSPLDPATGLSGRRITRFSPPPFAHIPVMAESVTEIFSAVPTGSILDATIGGGGHSYEILKSREDLNVIGIDQDPEALAAADAKLTGFADRVSLIHGRFDDLSAVTRQIGNQKLSGFLFDLGVSSYQLDNPRRGFSFRNDGPLDMRMNPNSQITAGVYVNEATEEELASLLYNYGDEKYSKRVAKAIVSMRPIHTTKELADIIRDAIPARSKRSPGHPARRSFQALRIAVNSEIEILESSIREAIRLLKIGGRGIVLSYHSGEDKVVKRTLRQLAGLDISNSKYHPEVRQQKSILLLARKAQRASSDEISRNPRASSALLRKFEKVSEL